MGKLSLLQEPSRGLLQDDVMIFEASVTVLGEHVLSKAALEAGGAQSESAEDLVNDLRTLWESGDRSDVVLRAGGVEIKAHGLLLAARSPVFERMLSAGMAEATTGIIEVQDIEPENLRRLCEFIYTGAVRDCEFWEDAQAVGSLLQAAVKYELDGLVHQCAAKVATMVTVESVID